MALRPVVSVGDGAITLSLDVDEAGTVVGWQAQNTSGLPVGVLLTSGGFEVRQTLPPGTFAGAVPSARRWQVDADTPTAYSLTVPWRR